MMIVFVGDVGGGDLIYRDQACMTCLESSRISGAKLSLTPVRKREPSADHSRATSPVISHIGHNEVIIITNRINLANEDEQMVASKMKVNIATHNETDFGEGMQEHQLVTWCSL